MGLQILLTNSSGHSVDLPQWNTGKFVGDREFTHLMMQMPTIRKNTACSPDYEPIHRPENFATWRTMIAEQEWPNPGRFEGLVDLLEADPELWIYLSF